MTTTLNTIPLPDDLQWPDEFAPRILQSLKTTLDATPHVTAMAKTKGIPISLTSWVDGAFVSRATVLLLQAAADQPALEMPLVLRDAVFQVMFRHHEGPAFTAEPIKDIANPDADDLYRITLNLMTI
ncbi:MAG: hypothetical protein QX198_00655 [Methylococcaceae bacterium]